MVILDMFSLSFRSVCLLKIRLIDRNLSNNDFTHSQSYRFVQSEKPRQTGDDLSLRLASREAQSPPKQTLLLRRSWLLQ